jgi:hypothetical protein
MAQISSAKLTDTEGINIDFNIDVIGYKTPSGFEIPLNDIQGNANYKEALLKDNLQIVLNNSLKSILKNIYITQELPQGKLQSILAGNNKVTFEVKFDTETFNNLNTSSPPEFHIMLVDEEKKTWGDSSNSDVEITLSSTKVSDGLYRATLEDASLNNGETYAIDALNANNNVATRVQVDYNNVDRYFTPYDRPSELSVPSAVNTLALDGSNNRMVEFDVQKQKGDFVYGAARYVLKVNDNSKSVALDVSNGRIINPATGNKIADASAGQWTVSLKRTDPLFNDVSDGATFSLTTYLEGKKADGSGNPTGAWISGIENTISNIKMNYPLASSGLEIIQVNSDGSQVVEFELEQPLSAYFDSSAGLQLAKVYHVNVDASGEENGTDVVKDFRNELKQQIDASGSTKKVTVDLSTGNLDNNGNSSYGKKLRVKLEAYETNKGTGSDNKLEKTTAYNVENCVPKDTADGVLTFTANTATTTLTWSDASANPDKLEYIVVEAHNQSSSKVEFTGADTSGNQVAVIIGLSAGVKYRNTYVYNKKAPTAAPYNALIPSGLIKGTQQLGSFFFAKTTPVLTSVTYALEDCSSTEFTRINVAGNANGNSIEQFIILASTNNATDVSINTFSTVIDASGLEDVCGNSLQVDALNNAAQAPTEFNVKLELSMNEGRFLDVYPLERQLIVVVMDTDTANDPFKIIAGKDVDEKASAYVKNYTEASEQIGLYEIAYDSVLQDYRDASSNVDASLVQLGNLLDASGKLIAGNTYNDAVQETKDAFNAWYVADASNLLAYENKEIANINATDFSNNFYGPALAKTDTLDKKAEKTDLNAWNNTNNFPIRKSVNNGNNIEIDGSGNVKYVYTIGISNFTAFTKISTSGIGSLSMDQVAGLIKTAFNADLSNANDNLDDAADADDTAYTTLSNKISARITAYATYENGYNTYKALVDDISSSINDWNDEANPSLNDLNTLKAGFAASFDLWKASKLAYDCSDNVYESLGTTQSDVALYNALVDDLSTDKYKLKQTVPELIPKLQPGQPDYSSIAFNPTPPASYSEQNGWPTYPQ